MPTRLLTLVLILALAEVAPAPAQTPAPFGDWLTQDGDAVVSIAPCGAAACGRIAGIRLDRATDAIPRDWQGQSQCGLPIIRDARPDGDAWRAAIVDPRNGDRYSATLRVDERDRLHLRGYLLVPLLGRTQIWTRWHGSLPADCRLTGEPMQANGAAPGFIGG